MYVQVNEITIGGTFGDCIEKNVDLILQINL